MLSEKEFVDLMLTSGIKFKEPDTKFKVTQAIKIPNSVASNTLGRFFVKKAESGSEEFLSAGVFPAIKTTTGIKYGDRAYKMDRAIGRIPVMDTIGDFSDLLPYIEDGSIEIRKFSATEHVEGWSDKSDRIYWKWNDKIQQCPYALEDYTILEGREWEGDSNWREVEGLSLEDFAF